MSHRVRPSTHLFIEQLQQCANFLDRDCVLGNRCSWKSQLTIAKPARQSNERTTNHRRKYGREVELVHRQYGSSDGTDRERLRRMARNFRSSAEDLTEIQRDDENERTTQFANSKIRKSSARGCVVGLANTLASRAVVNISVIQELKKYCGRSK
jgi:hypothetical protein